MKGWVIFLLAFSLYFVSIFGDFIQDDVKVVQSDLQLGKVSALLATWTRPYYYISGNEFSVYRPLTSFSFYLNALVTGKKAWGFRLGNVLIYGWVCVGVYEVLKKLKSSKTQKIKMEKVKGMRSFGFAQDDALSEWWRDVALWGAVIFTVLPIHTEVVNNIVGRAEMLSLGFVLLSILKILDRKWELASLFLFLGMLSKETAVVGVPILLYLVLVASNTEKKEKLGASVFVVMALLGFLLLRTVVLGGVGAVNKATMVENPLKFVSTEKRIMNGVVLIPFGVSKILFPINLSYDYSYNQIKLVDSWQDWRVQVGLGMAVLSGVFLFRFLFKSEITNCLRGQSSQALLVVGMILFWGPILITGNILFPIGTIFGERLWFWPSLGVVMLITAWFEVRKMTCSTSFPGVPWWIRSARHFACPSAPLLVIAMLLFLYMGRTVVRNFDWLNQERLFLHDAEYVTGSVMAQSNAAAMYLMQKNLTTGKIIMEKADKIYPQYPELLNNWGIYYLWTGKTVEARKKFEECLEERPGNGLCQGNLELVK